MRIRGFFFGFTYGKKISFAVIRNWKFHWPILSWFRRPIFVEWDILAHAMCAIVSANVKPLEVCFRAKIISSSSCAHTWSERIEFLWFRNVRVLPPKYLPIFFENCKSILRSSLQYGRIYFFSSVQSPKILLHPNFQKLSLNIFNATFAKFYHRLSSWVSHPANRDVVFSFSRQFLWYIYYIIYKYQ